jgi:hypothetical protein
VDCPLVDGGRTGGMAPNFEEVGGWATIPTMELSPRSLILGGAKWGSWDIGEDCHGPTMKTIMEGGATAAWKGSGWLGSVDMGRVRGVPAGWNDMLPFLFPGESGGGTPPEKDLGARGALSYHSFF